MVEGKKAVNFGKKQLVWDNQINEKMDLFLVSPESRQGFPGGSEVKASAFNEGEMGLIPGLGRFPGEGNGKPLQYSCLENLMERGAWWAIVHEVTKSWT